MNMTKDAVMQRIRNLAADRGGHVGFDTFVKETGIKDKWLRRQEWWTGWNSLLAELGLETRKFSVPRTPEHSIVQAVAALIEREGRWPTEDDLVRARKRDGSFPSLGVIRRLRSSGRLAALIIKLGEASGQFPKASDLARQHQTPVEDTADARPDEKVKGYVYLLRSGRRYKIGKSTDPSRRYREVRLELPEETHQVHTIPTDDPTGIEGYWQKRFDGKRIRNTEFFELDASDVQAFKRRKYQ
ncbi:MAG: GIY-YIG nuclease family protein [Gemmatimonadetes bacterium]|nr:GIY-YIG nuclease family protein [Gemmatimonadota bacterium]MBK7785768.1 GIY-YIG nuclease family protein [Gemmatimonadota bacterium]MBK9067110.1 GIY-YIG nuclease family protein [Gemmatimonadota bacterium]